MDLLGLTPDGYVFFFFINLSNHKMDKIFKYFSIPRMIPLSHNTDKIYLILVFKNFIYVPSLVCFCVGTFRICQGVAWIFFTYGPLLRRPVRMLLPNPHVCYLFFLVSFSPWASGDTRRRGR